MYIEIPQREKREIRREAPIEEIVAMKFLKLMGDIKKSVKLQSKINF